MPNYVENILHLENYILQNERLVVPPCKHTFVRDIAGSLAVFYGLTNHLLNRCLPLPPTLHFQARINRKQNLEGSRPEAFYLNLSQKFIKIYREVFESHSLF